MEPERPITLADVRRASRVFVWLPIGRYWRDDMCKRKKPVRRCAENLAE